VPIEIERKFLVSRTDWRQDNGINYSQGYLNLDKERTVRVRVTEKQAFLSVKGITKGMSRMEFEYEIPAGDAEQLLKLCEGSVIQKIRYTVIRKGLKWEIDEFLGDNKGLVIAEVELSSEDQIFDKPEWLGMEVTTDQRYINSNLAANPYNTWRDKNNL
jgi:CYTH domain-containing protein